MTPIILVPQGAEYQAVCQGIRQHPRPPKVLPIPIGVTAAHLDSILIDDISEILVMGLCGSLSPELGVGAVALYTACIDAETERLCDRALTNRLQDRFQVSPIRGFTSDRVICLAQEKRNLGKTYAADVVDMEGSAVLANLKGAIAMLRVVSDDAEHDLPDLSGTIDANGKLQALPLAIALCKRPIAATRLIRGSVVGLNVLRDLASRLPF